jgi:1,4-dihydroxy-6-naphthoate synthase
MDKRILQVGHSPDPDDAFMFYALGKGLIPTEDYEIKEIMEDIQTLNEWAKEKRLEVTALSANGYAWVSDQYALLPYGSSVGDMYGPKIVAQGKMGLGTLKEKKIAIPGELTTAYLVLKLALENFEYEVVPFQDILGKVQSGEYEAGLIIHEGQLTYRDYGLEQVMDLGQWWYETTALPLPLGVNAVRKDLGRELCLQISHWVKASLDYAASHREEAMAYALKYAGGVDIKRVDKFVSMYVNEDSMELREKTRKALELLFKLAKEKKLIPDYAKVDVAE